MTFISRAGIVAALSLAAAVSAPVSASVSPAVGKPLQAAANAAKSGNTSAAIAAIGQAKAAAKTPEERKKTAEMAGYIYNRAGQFGKAAAEMESVGAPPKQLAALYYQAGNYGKAIELARKAGGEDMQILIAQAAVKQGHYQEAVTAYNKLIASNGAKPIFLENLAGAQYKAGDKKAYLDTTEKLVRVDSSPARWKTLLVEQQKNQMSPQAKLALFHLMATTNNISRPEDYQEFAKLAIVNYQPGIAHTVLTQAGGSVTSDPMTAKLAEVAAQRAAAAGTQALKLAANPATAARAGGAYLGLGQYAAAAAAYGKAVAAGGNGADSARVFEGIAQVKGGLASAAKATFAAVPDSSGMKDIAQLWQLYASTHS